MKFDFKKWAQIIGLVIGGALGGVGSYQTLDDAPDNSKIISEHDTRITRLEARSDTYESDSREAGALVLN